MIENISNNIYYIQQYYDNNNRDYIIHKINNHNTKKHSHMNIIKDLFHYSKIKAIGYISMI